MGYLETRNTFNKPRHSKKQLVFDVMFTQMKKFMLNKSPKTYLLVIKQNEAYYAVRCQKDYKMNEPIPNLNQVVFEIWKTIDDSIHLACYNKPHVYNQKDATPFYEGYLSSDQFQFVMQVFKKYMKEIETQQDAPVLHDLFQTFVNDLASLEKKEHTLFEEIENATGIKNADD